LGIEFKHGGRTWRTDTPEEAIALRRQLVDEDRDAIRAAIAAGEDPSNYEDQIWTPDLVVDLLKASGRNQKEFLRVLFEKTEIPSQDVLKKLKLDSEMSLAGVLSGLSKTLKKLDLKPWDLYTAQIRWDAKGKTRSFRLSRRFRGAAQELGWPDEWI
jgi:hypothetical protein